jgi:hypothetical protein
MKVWLVTWNDGEGDDITGVFDSKKSADEFLATPGAKAMGCYLRGDRGYKVLSTKRKRKAKK